MKHLPWCLLLSVLAMVGPGCQSEKPVDPFQTGLIFPLDARRLGYTKIWRAELQVPADAQLLSARVLGDILVAVESPANLITATAVADGRLRWTRQVGQPGEVLYPPFRDGDRIYVNSETRLFVLEASTGRLAQVNPLEEVVITAPAVVGNLAIFAGASGRVFAQNVTNAKTVWGFQFPRSVDLSPAVYGDDVLIVDVTGAYKLLTVTGGDVRWGGRTFARNSAQPMMTEYGAIIASQDTMIYCIATETGKDRWRFAARQPLNQAPILLGGVLFQPLGQNGLVAIDPQTGSELWRAKDNARPVGIDGDRLLLYAPPRLLVANPKTGEIRQETLVRPLKFMLGVEDGSLILVSPDGLIERLVRSR
ncbi:MAG: PQQ-like beta-propeller repeat protein [Phycisphaeraceae bacterium]|nr:PQQ-like beta-propeller repeat protein [Phycisphaeraceae bacterium]